MLLKAMLFDLDGVMIDSLEVMKKAFSVSYRRLVSATGEIPIEEYLRHTGEAFGIIMKRMGLPSAMEAAFRAESLRLAEDIPLHSGIADVLQFLRDRQVKMAVVTGKDRLRTLDLLDRLDVQQYFDTIVTSCDVKNCKPDPEPIMNAITALNAAPEQSVMLGDSVSDMLSAVRAGVLPWGVAWGVGTTEELCAAGAEAVFKKPEELLQALGAKMAAATAVVAS